MTAPGRTTWTVAPDPNTSEDTLWRDDTSLIRRSDLYHLMAQVDADALFDVWVRALAPDEATIERLRDHVNQRHPTHQNDETGDVFCGCGFVYGDGQTHGISAVLQGFAALAGTSAQTRHTADDATGGA